MNDNYWSRTLQRRLSRRRALAGAGVLGAGALAASMIACGGDDEGGGGAAPPPEDTGLASTFVDTTSKAVQGGLMQSWYQNQPQQLEPARATSAENAQIVHVYSRLLRYKVGTVFDRPDGSVIGDAMTSWELANGGLQLTMKLRPNMKLDSRPPTNGRNVTTEDVKYAFDKWAQLNPARGNLLTRVVPGAPVDDLVVIDASTIAVKLSFPYGPIDRYLAWNWLSNVTPVEAEGKFDPRSDMRGSGPWMLTKFEPSGEIEYARNPNWYDASTKRPYLDGINYALLTEVAARDAQFRARVLWNLTPTPDQVAPILREAQGSLAYAFPPLEGNGGNSNWTMSTLPDQPFRDVRLRRAISTLIDRDAYIDTFGDLTRLQAEGLPSEGYWHSHTPCTWGSTIWLNPEENKLGEHSKWFHHSPDEAAKLLDAAGMRGITVKLSHRSDGSSVFNRQMDVMKQFLQEGGLINLDVETGPYAAWFQPTFLRGRAKWPGMAPTPQGGFPDFDGVLWGTFAPGARNDSIGEWENFPGLKELLERHRGESDGTKRAVIAQEWQRFMAENMPTVPFPGAWTTYQLSWPWLANFRVHRTWHPNGDAADVFPYWWYDKPRDTRPA